MTKSQPHRILLIEDDASGREMGAFNLRKTGHEVDVAETGEQGLASFSPEHHDLVITDIRMPGLSGIDVLKHIKERATDIPVVVITAFGSVDVAVEAMRAGAYDFIEKPFKRDQLLLTVERALENRALRSEVRSLRRQTRGIERPIVAVSQSMQRVLEIADRVAPTDATVLITGETGTGKELIARRIHARSARGDGPFVAVNCAAVPSELIESELFGHERGAFTGANRPRRGRFRQAQDGSLFLDEIGEMPLSLQGKLLRALQEKRVDVVGSDVPIEVNARVIAATNQDLLARVAEGAFRQDLYYRLNVVEIPIPPLRDRPEDIDALVDHFVSMLSGGRDITATEALREEMRRRPWPGNVRQLENACERLMILCAGDELRVEDLPPAVEAVDERASAMSEWPELPLEGLGLMDLEKRVIERVLQMKRGNVSQAAVYLRVPRHILSYRMAKYGIRRT
ncbi:MAG: sigma-54-dependent transcriptional regulator [Myxococcota bacterium]